MKKVMVIFFILLSLHSYAAMTAVWRPSEPAPSSFYNYFFVIDDKSGNIYNIFVLNKDESISHIVKVANIYTGEIFSEDLTLEWMKKDKSNFDTLFNIIKKWDKKAGGNATDKQILDYMSQIFGENLEKLYKK